MSSPLPTHVPRQGIRVLVITKPKMLCGLIKPRYASIVVALFWLVFSAITAYRNVVPSFFIGLAAICALCATKKKYNYYYLPLLFFQTFITTMTGWQAMILLTMMTAVVDPKIQQSLFYNLIVTEPLDDNVCVYVPSFLIYALSCLMSMWCMMILMTSCRREGHLRHYVKRPSLRTNAPPAYSTLESEEKEEKPLKATSAITIAI